jgi:hypothetical protein
LVSGNKKFAEEMKIISIEPVPVVAVKYVFCGISANNMAGFYAT